MDMKKLLFLFIALVCTFVVSAQSTSCKQRLIVATDLGGADPDDTQSLIHLLVCSDVVDIEGIISSSSWIDCPDWTAEIIKVIDGYSMVLPMLRKHSDGFPDAGYLKSIVKRGQSVSNMAGVGQGKDSPGSELIISAVDKQSDSRPVWLLAWSGMNTIAQAIWKVHESRTSEEFKRFVAKIRIYDVLGQDDAGAWIAKHFPEIQYIRNTQVYGCGPSDEWIAENVQSKEPFGATYPDRKWAAEGDTPSFLYVLANGLNVPDSVSYGGWGGRFSKEPVAGVRGMDFIEKSGKSEARYDTYYMYASAPEGVNAINKWKEHILNDFAARMIWTTTSEYSEANHHPIVVINNDSTYNHINIEVSAGETLLLDASSSFDPDNDDLHYEWMVYNEPGSYKRTVNLNYDNMGKCKVIIPNDARGKNFHVILVLTDDGVPSLTAYRRFVIDVK